MEHAVSQAGAAPSSGSQVTTWSKTEVVKLGSHDPMVRQVSPHPPVALGTFARRPGPCGASAPCASSGPRCGWKESVGIEADPPIHCLQPICTRILTARVRNYSIHGIGIVPSSDFLPGVPIPGVPIHSRLRACVV